MYPRRPKTTTYEATRSASLISTYYHPDYPYYKEDWMMIRDAIEGERRVKEASTLYLPPLSEGDDVDYNNYIQRAVFTNFAARTLNGFIGTVFRRPVKIIGVPANKASYFDRLTPEGMNAHGLAKRLTREILAVGRVGILVERDQLGKNSPYIAVYLAENILNWQTELRDGREVLTYVLLREISVVQDRLRDGAVVARADKTKTVEVEERYRVLGLDENGDYYSAVYIEEVIDNKKSLIRLSQVYPTKNGAKLKEIPFFVGGPEGPAYNIQKSPLRDVVSLNYAHYRTSAQLEHGRFYTALPIYYVPVTAEAEEREYLIGPSYVWEVEKDSKPGILEYYGTGLSGLQASLLEKEEHIAQLGGRLSSGDSRRAKGSDSSEVFNAKAANETSILLAATEAVDLLLTRALKFMADWDNSPFPKLRVQISQDFKLQNVGARELRAVAALYESGILPLEELHRVLQESEFISEETTVEMFRAMLQDPASFPNQPNVEAKMKGYPDAQAEFDEGESEADRALERELAKTEQANALRIAARADEQRKQEEAAADAMDRKTRIADRKVPRKPRSRPLKASKDA